MHAFRPSAQFGSSIVITCDIITNGNIYYVCLWQSTGSNREPTAFFWFPSQRDEPVMRGALRAEGQRPRPDAAAMQSARLSGRQRGNQPGAAGGIDGSRADDS